MAILASPHTGRFHFRRFVTFTPPSAHVTLLIGRSQPHGDGPRFGPDADGAHYCPVRRPGQSSERDPRPSRGRGARPTKPDRTPAGRARRRLPASSLLRAGGAVARRVRVRQNRASPRRRPRHSGAYSGTRPPWSTRTASRWTGATRNSCECCTSVGRRGATGTTIRRRAGRSPPSRTRRRGERPRRMGLGMNGSVFPMVNRLGVAPRGTHLVLL